MAREVIDLISSSPPPPLKSSSPPLFVDDTVPSGQGTEPCVSQPHEVDLECLSDEFDTTIDIDELISLPSFDKSSYANQTHNTTSKQQLTHISIETADATRQRIIQETIIDIHSDDFGSASDNDEPRVYESTSNGNKRRRVSDWVNPKDPPTLEHSDPFYSSQKEAPSGGNQDKCSHSANGPVEILSSPERPPTARSKLGLPLTTIENPPTTSFRTSFQSSPDPFKSPIPQHIPCSNPPLSHAPKHVESSDPFASSPRETCAKENAPKAARFPDIEIVSSAPSPPRFTSNTASRRDWDPISSSAPEIGSHALPDVRRQKATAEVTISVDSDSSVHGFESESDEDELPDITQLIAAPRKRSSLHRSYSDNFASKSRSKASKPTKSTAERARERETKAAATAAEKARKQREREQDKAAKSRDKERAAALAEVNKIRTDKKISTPEMLVDLSANLNPTTRTQVEPLLKALDVEFSTWESPVDNVIKWRRKVTSRFNEDLGHWEPVPRRIQNEKHVAVIVLADEFVQLALSGGLDDHVSKMTEHFPNHQLIYLIEGLHVWMRKNRNTRNRQFVSGVRVQEGAAPSSSRRRNAPAAEYVSEETIEDALLQLQVMHDALIHHTTIPLETSQWITVLTQHISTIPYRKQKDQATMNAAFCMESGQVRSGDNPKDTYIRMLQEISRVTAPVAYGIAAEFGTVSELVNGLESGGANRLEAVRKSANKDGVMSDRTVGQALSKRLHKVFTGRDESSTDV
ncbi:unnamed protein product [Clonostachys rhizophaga]|uniref:ERCC4 domain-containing protein n=1 Tax=Clonostachys rhizophaga TaxID=160324 RepID=A0A9N9YW62_9HYPO|nr:unnamed protein product [Clonostachys rhizophaga]